MNSLKKFQTKINIYRDPATILSYSARYERMMTLFYKHGYFCTTIPQQETALIKSFQATAGPSFINLIISLSADRKPQAYNWLQQAKL